MGYSYKTATELIKGDIILLTMGVPSTEQGPPTTFIAEVIRVDSMFMPDGQVNIITKSGTRQVSAQKRMTVVATPQPDDRTPKSLQGKQAAQLIQAARDNYANDDIEIDDDARFSLADEGTWVAAWVWVNNAEESDEPT